MGFCLNPLSKNLREKIAKIPIVKNLNTLSMFWMFLHHPSKFDKLVFENPWRNNLSNFTTVFTTYVSMHCSAIIHHQAKCIKERYRIWSAVVVEILKVVGRYGARSNRVGWGQNWGWEEEQKWRRGEEDSAVWETVRLCFALSPTELPVAKKGSTLTY